ncbi:MAG TPA: dNTP triphosphohydrolase [Anaerohalosphaeraceae bacterium]|nr:dNTP triphosphohydrolase [Anaerohalosphaeraceae bacterium]
MNYSLTDAQRIKPTSSASHEEYRSPWRRDYARLIHSPSFRRLQGKTQLFPGLETDFFRNRLTHSLEVAQIAKTISLKLNHNLQQQGLDYQIESDIVEFAALAHDLGHPPFGHFGEQVLDELMLQYGGFEGNAQTLRLLTKIEKKEICDGANAEQFGIDDYGRDLRLGLNLSFRSLASILKYDRMIPLRRQKKQNHKPVKGYYGSEKNIVSSIKLSICGREYPGTFKTIECQIMDIADDIAYSTYDLEDSFKAGFLKPVDIICASDTLIENVVKKVRQSFNSKITLHVIRKKIKDIFSDLLPQKHWFDALDKLDNEDLIRTFIPFTNNKSNLISENGYFRCAFTSKLVNKAIEGIYIQKINKKYPALSTVSLRDDTRVDIEILKNLVFESQILSPKIQIVALRTREIIETLFNTLSNNADSLLPADYKSIYQKIHAEHHKKRVICDFIAGMTDRYALEFYARLTSENPQTIFKPL